MNSLISPLEVKVRQPELCTNCRTHDCLRGNESQRGCETALHLPRKVGNMDCTFCLDCARACPHDNVGVLAVVPGADLVRDPLRSSIGRLSQRLDLAALGLVLVSAAFVGAAAMTRPVMTWLSDTTTQLGLRSPRPLIACFFVMTLAVLPVLVVGSAVALGRALTRAATPTREFFCRFSLALVPLGAAMWAGHSLFHWLSGYATVWPILQQASSEFGLHFLGTPDWNWATRAVSPDGLLSLQVLLLDVGLLLTLYVGWRIAREEVPQARSALRLVSPWMCVVLALFSLGVWIFLQPMQMRGITDAMM
jgi:hypothetical protein